tara:strand:- start:3102 stop:3353 length:252 start_codon:yes stop_codon:yes gene_type:complete
LGKDAIAAPVCTETIGNGYLLIVELEGVAAWVSVNEEPARKAAPEDFLDLLFETIEDTFLSVCAFGSIAGILIGVAGYRLNPA